MALASKAAAAAMSITALACLAAPEVKAIQVIVGGNSYDVTTFTDSYTTFNGSLGPNASKFNITDMPWWGVEALATQFASAVGTGLGLPDLNGLAGPTFAYNLGINGKYFLSLPGGITLVTDTTKAPNLTYTYAVLVASPASTSAVPGPLPLFGAAAAFGWSRRLRSRLRLVATVS